MYVKIFSLLLIVLDQAFAHDYIVKKNDSLSCLAEVHVGSPVYGDSGSLELLKKINSEFLGSNELYVGGHLRLPAKEQMNKFINIKPDQLSTNCIQNLSREEFSKNSCGKTARGVSSYAETNYAKSCERICPHVHDNDGYVVSFEGKKDKEDKKLESFKEVKVSERYIKEIGLYQNSLTVNSNVDATNAEWVSRENFYLKGGYQIKKNNWWYGFTAEYHLLSFGDVDSLVYSWDGDLPNLLKFSITANREYGRFDLGISIDYNQELFFTEEAFEVSLEEVFMLGGTVALSYNFLKLENYLADVRLELTYPYLGSADMNPEGEFGYQAYLNLKKSSFLDRFEMTLSAYYGEKNFMTNTFDQQEQFVGLSLSLRDKVN